MNMLKEIPKEIFDKAYGPELTLREKKQIEECVYVLKDNIAVINQIKQPNPAVYEVEFNKLSKLANELGDIYLMVNVQHSNRPNAKNRYFLKTKFNELSESIIYATVVTGKNLFLNTIAKLVLRRAGLKNFDIFENIDEALEHIDSVISLRRNG